ncbi:MAG: Sec-independent protein translocase protein TatB [Afipia sp.]|jgi:sec-independent protein translocase protein TatB|nr:Sec-independent protein translocase protein TatB [Afipia sp.]
MFDIGWSELLVIAVVALIAIGPKELPGVLRMIGQWMGKARRMASDFQGQFNEAMREAEMADIKKTFDDAAGMAKDLSPTNLLSNLAGDSTKQVEDALKIDQPQMTSTAQTPPTPLPPTRAPATAKPKAAAKKVAEKAPAKTPSKKTKSDAKAS